jgi:hypothetical protein
MIAVLSSRFWRYTSRVFAAYHDESLQPKTEPRTAIAAAAAAAVFF